MPYTTLTDAERTLIGRVNARNGYGISTSILKKLCLQHRMARKNNDIHTMEKIEYRLTDINFHHECSLLHYGQYEQFMEELKGF